ncbi:stimulated by retinoic acid gene 6 protein-like [Orbicella faveolata]|uniref:stimulated by retinoic acid gene 6 protein-like n=1 Tax=Orbicella faveolata TaxID=48498 RepID=UPI0009E1C460|nr:stimulated by retinoic acid gene 6 protein-like [Orbicella faveolata]
MKYNFWKSWRQNKIRLVEYFKRTFLDSCDIDSSCDMLRLVFGSLQGGYIVAAFFAILILLHFMKCHRDHIFQLYRGQTTFSQDVFVSPARLVGRSLRFSGYQIAFVFTGNVVMGFFMAVIALILGFIFRYAKEIFSAETLTELKGILIAMLPTVGMAISLWAFQKFLELFAFRDRDFPNIAITVDNKRLFSIMAYFFFFYNILLGVFSCLVRILKGMLLGVVFLSRIDRTSMMQGFQTWDQAFVAYLGFIHLLVAHSHPVMLMFCQLLINRNKDRTFQESLEQGKSKTRARFRIQGWLKMGAGVGGKAISVTKGEELKKLLECPKGNCHTDRWSEK